MKRKLLSIKKKRYFFHFFSFCNSGCTVHNDVELNKLLHDYNEWPMVVTTANYSVEPMASERVLHWKNNGDFAFSRYRPMRHKVKWKIAFFWIFYKIFLFFKFWFFFERWDMEKEISFGGVLYLWNINLDRNRLCNKLLIKLF